MAGREGSDAAVVRAAISALGRRLREHDRDDGVGATGLLILARLLRLRSAGAKEIARLEGLQPQSLTRAFKSLEEDGLVERDVDDLDHRRAVITITAKGEELLRASVRRRTAWLTRAIAARLTSSERDTLREAAILMQLLAESDAPSTPPSDAVFNLIPFVAVGDVARSLAFYQRLGFTEDGRDEAAGHLVWASMHARAARSARIMFARTAKPARARDDVTFTCWSDDLLGLHARLTAAGLRPSPLSYPEYMPDGEFRLRDPDDHLVVIGQPRRRAARTP